MNAGRFARLSGVSADTIRYYERRGVLPRAPRSTAGYRQFPQQSLARVKLVRAALSVGFSIDELVAIFAQRDRGIAPCRQVRALAAEKLEMLETLLADLHAWRRRLKEMLADWDQILDATPNGRRAGLLESLAAKKPGSLQTRSLALFAKRNVTSNKIHER
jgi:DNA-binding transcriptional MerR regulator